MQSDFAGSSESFSHISATRLHRLTGQLLAVALVLFAVFGVSALASLWPVKPLEPIWLWQLSTTLVSQAWLPLLGMALVGISSVFSINDNARWWRRTLSRWSLVVSLGFALLVPLQILAAWQLSHARATTLEPGRSALETSSQELAAAIETARDVKDLQNQLNIYRAPGLIRGTLDRPLPELKRNLLIALREKELKERQQWKSASADLPQVKLSEVLQLSVASLAFAAGFASFAQRRGTAKSLLEEAATTFQRRSDSPRSPLL